MNTVSKQLLGVCKRGMGPYTAIHVGESQASPRAILSNMHFELYGLPVASSVLFWVLVVSGFLLSWS